MLGTSLKVTPLNSAGVSDREDWLDPSMQNSKDSLSSSDSSSQFDVVAVEPLLCMPLKKQAVLVLLDPTSALLFVGCNAVERDD
mgnify:FL=1